MIYDQLELHRSLKFQSLSIDKNAKDKSNTVWDVGNLDHSSVCKRSKKKFWTGLFVNVMA